MSLLDRVQRRAEDGVPSGSPGAPGPPVGPAPAAPPPNLRVAVPGDTGSEPAPAQPVWSMRASTAAAPAPAAPPRAAAPAAPAPWFNRPGAPASPPAPLVAGRDAAPGGDGARASSSLLNRTGIRAPGRGPAGAMYSQLRTRVHQRLVEDLAGNTDSAPGDVVRQRIAELVVEAITEQNLTMTRQDRQRVVDTLIHDVLGLGPLEDLLADPTSPRSWSTAGTRSTSSATASSC